MRKTRREIENRDREGAERAEEDYGGDGGDVEVGEKDGEERGRWARECGK